MVKGISRQVIVVQSPDPKMFEQAIFILKDDAVGKFGVTEEDLLKEATRIINKTKSRKKMPLLYFGPIWAGAGALATGIVWLFSML